MRTDPSGTRAPQYLNEPLRTGTEINVTGKWVPRAEGGFFRKSPESDDLLKEWANIHADARAATLLSDFGTTSAHHAGALLTGAKPGGGMSAGRSG